MRQITANQKPQKEKECQDKIARTSSKSEKDRKEGLYDEITGISIERGQIQNKTIAVFGDNGRTAYL